mmetsp:Transcript_17/g.56  ORF Transcript_17/g.56 Transcript_17/m.56 type:complete len:87 (-) Transcript_17:821-1081(-)
MPGCFFILARFFLRVDRVIVRSFDTRLYHEFGSDIVVKETVKKELKLTEDTFESILGKTADEVQPLLDEISKTVTNLPLRRDAPSA